MAIKMVLDFILERLHQKIQLNKVLILSDSQSSIGILALGWDPTQQKITAKDILTKMELIKSRGTDIDIQWTPGHAEIKGNEEADKLAKEASKEAGSMTHKGACISKSELKQAAKSHGLTVWQCQWDISERGRFYMISNLM